ncbi:hypothetical protein BJY21_001275 [Kineosphaera limosa]|uniref:Uncharacterized protein n=1 Tax=Kineosphaera limosa NBRC 100340 TaxID=1184609 RepID=K6W962_9MICO|nr:ABC-2 transporter permease [Kineosphaera limosa]NYE00091.1 hypothetical protein [Kineosphaera limosa]GAB95735.1 hypothetical protein KILIM_026_00060 [Kineosphaera limosa NBRC 100340]
MDHKPTPTRSRARRPAKAAVRPGSLRRALRLDVSLAVGQHTVLGGLSLVTFALFAVFGPAFYASPFIAFWMASLAFEDRNLESSRAQERLMCVLGLTRAELVRARFVHVTLLAVGLAMATGAVGLVWHGLGRDLTQARLVLAMIAAMLLICAVSLTLRYSSWKRWHQTGSLATLAVVIALIVAVPLSRGADFWSGTAELDAWLYGGPIPPVLVFAGAAVAVLVAGCRLAERAFARTDL